MANDVKEIGEVVWVDLTIPGAEKVVRDFYQSVIGWEADAFNMGSYNDFVVKTPENKQTVAGICHAQGDNASMPPYWIVYIKVKSLEASLAAARSNGGQLLAGPKQFGGARFCVLKDPAGAVFGIIEGEASDGQ
jgi:predicted enzyme related to lactoylglutathione lyase